MKPAKSSSSPTHSRSRARRRHLVRWSLGTTAVAVVAALSFGLLGSTGASAAKTPYTPTFTAPVEAYPRWTSEKGCHEGVRPGVTATIEQILKPTYGGAEWRFLTQRVCSWDMEQGHDDGTSLDWMNRYDNSDEKANVEAFLGWMMATDNQGNTRAIARRLGIMYLIWNNQFFGMYDTDAGWEPYNIKVNQVKTPCSQLPAAGYDTVCHRDHLHISFTPEGANMLTSYWKQGESKKTPTPTTTTITPTPQPTTTITRTSLPTTPTSLPTTTLIPQPTTTTTTPPTLPTTTISPTPTPTATTPAPPVAGPTITTSDLRTTRGSTVTLQGTTTKPGAYVQIYVRRAGGTVWIPILMPFAADASQQFTLVYVTFVTHEIKVVEGSTSSNITRVTVG